jgi:hypothetical protein
MRSILNDQISCTDQAATNGNKDAYQKKAFKEWSTSHVTTLPLLRGTLDMEPFMLIVGEAAGQRQFRPGTYPFAHILIRASAKGF